jgi:hypothetical protein
MCKEIIDSFNKRFNEKEKVFLPSDECILDLESQYSFQFPIYYKLFIQSFGEAWTPYILDIIVDNNLSIYALQEIWPLNQIESYLSVGWASKYDIIPFGSDCLGNLFFFDPDEICSASIDAAVYYYDFDFKEREKISDSFCSFLDIYNQLPVN